MSREPSTGSDLVTMSLASARTHAGDNPPPLGPVRILSGNDIEHALLSLAAMHVGIPYAPISVPYSLMSQDFKKLAAIIDILTPGLVFAANGTAFARAIAAAVPASVEVAVAAN